MRGDALQRQCGRGVEVDAVGDERGRDVDAPEPGGAG